MLKRIFLFSLALAILAGNLRAQTASRSIPTPASFFGFQPGTDRELFNYESLIDYMKILADQSPRISMIEIGTSPLGRTMYAAFLSSEKNIRNLSRLKEINRKLALDPDIPAGERKALYKEGKVFILATLSMHSTEVGPSQSAPLVAYQVATTQDPDLLGWLNDVVYMMVPCHNPDGMDMVVENYNKYKGTKYEGCSLPRVYHKYVGHDNNRDFVTLSQTDTKAIAALYNKTWLPQVMIEKHQMGSTGARYFVPPVHDPIADNIDEQIWNWTWIFGSNMSKDMSVAGLAGVSQHYLFDDYWPGSTETAIWKNLIGMLTECASAHLATPVFVEKNELSVGGKGLGEYKKSINMPFPWEGGWWRLSDIIQYELATTWSLIKTGSKHHDEILAFRNDLCRREVKKGKTEAPFFYVIPASQRDVSALFGMIDLLNEHGVNVYQCNKPLVYEGRVISKGDYVVPLSQPYRAFIKEVMEAQKFPARHYMPGGELIRPYDITSWSLPLHRGIKSMEIDHPFGELNSALVPVTYPLEKVSGIPGEAKVLVLSASRNDSYHAVFDALQKEIPVKRVIKESGGLNPGDFLITLNKKSRKSISSILSDLAADPSYLNESFKGDATPLTLPKIGLIETWFSDSDAGWTRFIFDSYSIPFDVLRPADLKEKELGDYDVLVFPNDSKGVLMEGKYQRGGGSYSIPSYDPKYIKGMGKEGLSRLMKFIDDGGVVISWEGSTALFMGVLTIKHDKENKEEFQLPIRDLSSAMRSSKVYIPGSLLKVNLLKNHPLCYGMPATTNVFSRGTPVFATSVPHFDMDRRVVGTYAEDHILVSGYAENEDQLADKTVLAWLKKGKGQLVLFGFNPQFRASTPVNFKLLFNGLLLK